jgi:hypothetical protein
MVKIREFSETISDNLNTYLVDFSPFVDVIFHFGHGLGTVVDNSTEVMTSPGNGTGTRSYSPNIKLYGTSTSLGAPSRSDIN